MRWLLLIPLVVCVGCFKPTLAEVDCGQQRECPPATVCDVDNVCRSPDQLRGPDASPDGPRNVDELGFDVDHLLSPIEDFGDLELVISTDVSIDTTAGVVGAPFNVSLISAAQVDGPQTSVLVVKKLTILASGRLTVRGLRGLIIVSKEAVVIEGVIDASAVGIIPGAGASDQGRGADGGSAGESHAAGGGGAHETFGGRGGATENQMGGNGGEPVGDAAMTVLLGGSHGGGGARGISCERVGGGGGGAIQIATPDTVTVGITGAITTGGGGGQSGGPCPQGRGGPGAGGGSGGAIYLQGMIIAIDGALIANGGGGGGGGGDDDGQDGDPGIDGSRLALSASGGRGGDDSGDGGSGGGLGVPQDGIEADNSNGGGGGGGGAAGRIGVDGRLMVGDNALISPAASSL